VARSPVAAPLISIIVLSAVVVPWTNASSDPQNPARSTPSPDASWPRPVTTPSDWSSSWSGLVKDDLTVRRDADEVGEGPTDVDADPVFAFLLARPVSPGTHHASPSDDCDARGTGRRASLT